MVARIVLSCSALLWISACGSNFDNQASSNSKDTDYKDLAKDELATDPHSFHVFLEKFNANCTYQRSNTNFPLPCISLTDFEENNYDTTYLSSSDFECMKLTEPSSDIIRGQVYLKYEHKPNEVVIILGVEDTGVRISYFFSFATDWRLVKIVDEST